MISSYNMWVVLNIYVSFIKLNDLEVKNDESHHEAWLRRWPKWRTFWVKQSLEGHEPNNYNEHATIHEGQNVWAKMGSLGRQVVKGNRVASLACLLCHDSSYILVQTSYPHSQQQGHQLRLAYGPAHGKGYLSNSWHVFEWQEHTVAYSQLQKSLVLHHPRVLLKLHHNRT